MHRTSRLLVGALLLLTVPSLASASTVDVEPSTFSLSISTLPPITLPSNQATIAVSSGAGTFTEPAGVFGPASVGLPRSLFTGVSLISGLTIAGIGNGAILCDSTVPELNCSGGLEGTALVNVLQLFNLSIPLSVVGNPGASVRVNAGGIIITVIGQKWTAGPTSVTGITGGPALSNGLDERTPGHGGTLVLVSGFKAVTNVAGSLPGFAVQNLQLAPEPVEILMLLVGLAGFGLYAGVRRLRR